MAEVKRRRNESFEGVLRRFSRRISESGRLLEARKRRFHGGSPTKNAARKSALRRIKKGTQREWLIKSGRVSEADLAVKKKPGRR
ncbi:30S ribosomal protein S21 [Candidatus Uhrbacteria bacterium]|nr:30S ribosomal protein S21 [Candidatus Uhrbacteria bacterium]